MTVLVGAVAGAVSILAPVGEFVTTVEVGTSEAMEEEVEETGSEFVNQDMSTRLPCGESSSLSESSDGASESYRSSLSSPSDILGSESSTVTTFSVPAIMPVSPVEVLWREMKSHMMFRGRNYKVPLKRHGSIEGG